MDASVLTEAAQFGAAGLMGWMWLTERRHASLRESQLSAAHERMMEQRVQLDALLAALRESTRAVTAMEAGQRALVGLIERLGARGSARSSSTEPAGSGGKLSA